MPTADMSVFYTVESVAFRHRVRSWFEANLPAGWGTADYARPASEAAEVEFLRNWQRRLHEGGWAGLSWPVEYGGQGASLIEQAIFQSERDRMKAPDELGLAGIQMVGPMLIGHGTQEQKDRYLRPMLTGEHMWCQGFSEPNAGSDLANIKTRASWNGQSWVINGQKVWTSRITAADFIILLARTNPDAPKHDGLSAFVVPIGAPGLEYRPIPQMNGAHDFSEVFFDNVELESAALIGSVDRGWDVAVNSLSFERIATTRAFEMRRLTRELISRCRVPDETGVAPIESGVVRDALAALAADAASGVHHFLETIAIVHASGEPGSRASVDKLHTTELSKRVSGLAMTIFGAEALRRRPTPWFGGPIDLTWEFTSGFKHTIAAGTSQIQRDIIGTRVLGLPR
jgi:alkylation response protein AidB-like acyl-CoA dehydrogenase